MFFFPVADHLQQGIFSSHWLPPLAFFYSHLSLTPEHCSSHWPLAPDHISSHGPPTPGCSSSSWLLNQGHISFVHHQRWGIPSPIDSWHFSIHYPLMPGHFVLQLTTNTGASTENTKYTHTHLPLQYILTPGTQAEDILAAVCYFEWLCQYTAEFVSPIMFLNVSIQY